MLYLSSNIFTPVICLFYGMLAAMIALIYIVSAVLCAAGAIIVQRLIHRNKHAVHPAAFYLTSASVSVATLGILALIRGDIIDISLLPKGNLLLTGLLWASSNIMIIKTMQRTEASLFSVLFTTSSLWSILIALVFLDESLTDMQIAGIAVVLIGTVAAIYRRNTSWNMRSIAYSLLTAFLFGAAIANDGVILSGGHDVPSYTAIAFLIPVTLVAALQPRAILDVPKIAKKRTLFPLVALLGALYAGSSMFFFLSFQTGENLSLLSGIFQAQTVLGVIGAIIFLKERDRMIQKIIGAIIVFAGLILLIPRG